MPTSSAVCWYCRGTANLVMMMMKMNRLSIEREYSVSQPAKNSRAVLARRRSTQTPMPNATASADVDDEVPGDLASSTARAGGGR